MEAVRSGAGRTRDMLTEFRDPNAISELSSTLLDTKGGLVEA